MNPDFLIFQNLRNRKIIDHELEPIFSKMFEGFLNDTGLFQAEKQFIAYVTDLAHQVIETVHARQEQTKQRQELIQSFHGSIISHEAPHLLQNGRGEILNTCLMLKIWRHSEEGKYLLEGLHEHIPTGIDWEKHGIPLDEEIPEVLESERIQKHEQRNKEK